MKCRVDQCNHDIPEGRIRRIGRHKVKACSSICAVLYRKQTRAQRLEEYRQRQKAKADGSAAAA